MQIRLSSSPSDQLSSYVRSDVDEPGLIDFLVEGEKSIQAISGYMDQINSLTNKVSTKLTTRTGEIESIGNHRSPGSAEQIHKLAKTIGADLSEYSKQVETILPSFRTAWEKLVESSTGIFNSPKVDPMENCEDIHKLTLQLEKGRKGFSAALAATKNARQSISGSLSGITGDLNRAVRRTELALDGITEVYTAGESYFARMLSLLEERE